MSDYALIIEGEEIELDFDEPVVHYPYRTATVTERFNERRDGGEHLQNLLAHHAGVRPGGNHEVFGVTLDNGKVLYILFYDEYVIYGWSVTEGHW